MSLDSSGLEVLPAGEDCVFSKSPDDFLSLALCSHKHQQIRHEKESKGRQKRFRSKRLESFKSPPHKRKYCDAPSPREVPVNMSFDCFFLTTSKKHHKPPVIRTTFWQKRKPSDSCFVVKSKEMKMFFKLTGKDSFYTQNTIIRLIATVGVCMARIGRRC